MDPAPVIQMKEIASEFIGTFMLVLSVGCNVLTGSKTWAVTSIACTLMVSIYALGGVSGGHFNPAVSATMIITGKEAAPKMAIYMAVQIVAGIVASLCYTVMFGSFNLAPSDTWWQAGLAELFYTCMLCFVVLNVAASRQHGAKKPDGDGDDNQFYGLAIGFVVIAGGYGAGHLSGGCFNPAVAIGVDISSFFKGFGWCFAYVVFELLGAAAAAGLYKACRPDDASNMTKASSPADYPIYARMVSEAYGTFMLVLTVGLNVLGGSPAPVWSIAASLMCMIFALGSCSGAHFNPAVTLAIAIRDGFSSGKNLHGGLVGNLIIVYIWVAQFLGGLLAAVTFVGMEKGKNIVLGPGKGYGYAEAYTVEVFFTFLLAFTVVCVATRETEDDKGEIKDAGLGDYFGLAIASCVTAGGYAIGAVSGGSLNPAVSFGLGATSPVGSSTVHMVMYIIAELAAGAIAGLLYKVVYPAPKTLA